jgi:hypothetical protein
MGLVGRAVACEHPSALDSWPLNQATARLRKPTVIGRFSSDRTLMEDRRVASSTATWTFSQPAPGEVPLRGSP